MDMYWSIFLALCVVLVTLLLRGHKHGGKKTRRLPPGPPSLPLLGSVVWLTNSPADVEPLLQRLFTRYGPVVSLRVGSRLTVYVADRRVAHAALVDHGAALADRPGALVVAAALLGENSNTITRSGHGHTWRLLRRNLVAGTLHPTRVRLVYAPARSWARRVLSDKLLLLVGGEEDDVLGAFRHAVFCLLTAMCFGERLDEATVRAIAAAQRDQQLYFGTKMSVFAFLPSVTRHLFRGRLQTARALRRRHRELLVPLIDARRDYIKNNKQAETCTTSLEHSYVDTLLDVRLPRAGGEESRPLTEQEVVNLCTEFLTAGTDTTTSAMQWIMAELVKNPDIQNKLYSEIKAAVPDDDGQDVVVTEEDIDGGMPYLRAVVLEGLRKHPPSHLVLPHRAAEDVEVGTYLIPKGATVNFMVAEMGRDAEEWDNPMEFAPERFLPGGNGEGVDVTGGREIRMMPFGVGRRICPGLGVATLHLQYLLANMVREFEWKEVAGDDEVDMAEKRGYTCFMKKPLRPRLVPRRSSEKNQFTCSDNESVVLD